MSRLSRSRLRLCCLCKSAQVSIRCDSDTGKLAVAGSRQQQEDTEPDQDISVHMVIKCQQKHTAEETLTSHGAANSC